MSTLQISFQTTFHFWKLCPHLVSTLQNIPEAALCFMERKKKNSLVCQLMLEKKNATELLILFVLCLRLPLSSPLWNECNWICIQMYQTPWVTVQVRSQRCRCNRQFSKDNSLPLMLFWEASTVEVWREELPDGYLSFPMSWNREF